VSADGQGGDVEAGTGVREPVQKKDPAEEAARLGMFGPLTRSRGEFFPTRLTCKRFGVKPPAHVMTDPVSEAGGAETGSSRDRDGRLDVVSKRSMEAMMQEAAWDRSRGNASGGETGGQGVGERQVDAEPLRKVEEVDVERNEAIEGPRAVEDLLKSIFGDDDDA